MTTKQFYLLENVTICINKQNILYKQMLLI